MVLFMVRATVLCVGDEVLRGEIVNTNASDMARALVTAGTTIVRQSVVGDDVDAIVAEVNRARDGSDILVVSGGLGPTHDDITIDAVASALSRPVAVDPQVEKWVEESYRSRGKGEITDVRLRMARVPEGGVPVRNAVGVAPAIRIESGTLVVYLLPGVPSELRHFLGELFPPVGSSDEVVEERVLLIPDESIVAEPIYAIVRSTGAKIGIYPGKGEVRVRIRGKRSIVDAALSAMTIEGLIPSG